MNITLVFEVLTFLGTVIAVWTNLNNKITKLESQVENDRKSIEKIEADRRDLSNELKEIKSILMEMKVELAKLEVVQKIRNNED